MAKYRHRVFEMYEFSDEATHALTPKSARPATVPKDWESWTFKQISVSHSAIVAHVRFKSAEAIEEEAIDDLREDFSRLADRLDKDSKVLVDFSGVDSICPAVIDELMLFHQRLRTRGSRLALCCLDPAVHQAFFEKDYGQE